MTPAATPRLALLDQTADNLRRVARAPGTKGMMV